MVEQNIARFGRRYRRSRGCVRYPRAASATPIRVMARAMSCRGPRTSPSINEEPMTPIMGDTSTVVAAVDAGTSFSARNHARYATDSGKVEIYAIDAQPEQPCRCQSHDGARQLVPTGLRRTDPHHQRDAAATEQNGQNAGGGQAFAQHRPCKDRGPDRQGVGDRHGFGRRQVNQRPGRQHHEQAVVQHCEHQQPQPLIARGQQPFPPSGGKGERE